MKTAALVVGSFFAMLSLLLYSLFSIRYRITPRHLKITLFGISIRRVPLKDIESVSKRRGSGLTENWWNTLKSNHRVLVVRRRRGLCRNLVITPRNRYVFRTDLERAVAEATSSATGEAHRKTLIITD